VYILSPPSSFYAGSHMFRMNFLMTFLISSRFPAFLGLLFLSAAAHAQQGELNVLCGVQQEWCHAVQEAFSRETGIVVSMRRRSAGEAFEQLLAESRNPKTDVWFGGTGDAHLQAAEKELTLAYRSPNILLLRDWAVTQAEQARYRSVGIYAGPLGFAFNTQVLKQKKLDEPSCWSDLIRPQYRGEVQMANPHTSGTAFMAVATLIQIMGEDKAFRYFKGLHRNTTGYPREGHVALKNTALGQNAVSVSFIHDVPGEVAAGYPVQGVVPCEGTGYEVGSMSIVKGARNLGNAKKFYDWALTAPAQDLAARTRQFQLPANRAATVDLRVPDIRKIRLINYDFERFGRPSERYRILDRWDREVLSLPLAKSASGASDSR
jgi:iron(III) transport system substrate-binding protein